MNKIVIKGIELPMRITMGAMLDFKKETGNDVSQLGNDMEQLITFMWCCIRSACRADKIDFNLTLQEFADAVDLSDFNTFSDNLSTVDTAKKKEKK